MTQESQRKSMYRPPPFSQIALLPCKHKKTLYERRNGPVPVVPCLQPSTCHAAPERQSSLCLWISRCLDQKRPPHAASMATHTHRRTHMHTLSLSLLLSLSHTHTYAHKKRQHDTTQNDRLKARASLHIHKRLHAQAFMCR